MKHLNNYKIFESKEDIHTLCRKYSIKNYTINSNGSIDVDGYVDLKDRNLYKSPLKFNRVTDGFYFQNNNLTSLEGFPKYIGGDFSCSYNNITSLEGCPEYVGCNFFCTDNDLISLEGSPKYVGGYFYFNENNITSLEGSPKYVGGDFNCQNNKITSLEGYPEHVRGGFYCEDNPMYSIVLGFIYRKDKDNLIELFNYYDIIQDRNVIYDRLKYFYETIDFELTDNILTNIEDNGYKIIY